ncbi:MAG: rhomboid family intramembrane serine protease [Planctomycetota bacterium]
MSWRERDYSRETWGQARAGGGGLRWPTRGAGVLIVLHILAFFLLAVIAEDESGAGVVAALELSQQSVQPLAILLHPFATRSVLTLIITVVVIWSLAGRIERQFGLGRMLTLYITGNLLAGIGFFTLASFWPIMAGVELDSPTGAFAAWCVALYRAMSGEMIMVMGQMRRASRVFGVVAAAAILLLLMFRGTAGLGWLTALIAGGLAEPIIRTSATLKLRPRERRPRVHRSIPHPPKIQPDEPNIDDILAKISTDGLDALTPEERNRLEAARQAKLQQAHETDPTR